MPGPRRPTPPAQPTRGKTARNRLRRTDTFVLLDRPSRLRHLPACYVDLGFGAEPDTTLETAARLGPHWSDLVVIGVELDPERVERAASAARPGRIDFRVGGFDLPLAAGEVPGVIRAANVLRQYAEADHAPAVQTLLGRLAPGGLLLEGTSSPTGRLLAMNVYEPGDPPSRRLVLSVNLRRLWRPRELQAVLPKNLIHRAPPDSPLDTFFGHWERTWTQARSRQVAPAAAFADAADALAAAGYDIDRRRAMLRRGFLIVRENSKISGPNPPVA